MPSLTPRQKQILELIREFMDTNGFPPTRAEIARALGFRSPNAAEDHLKALARKGAIELLPGASRGIRLNWVTENEKGLPVVSRIAADNAILAQDHIEGHYRIDPALFHPRADYLLRMRGMSMGGMGLLDGDLLAVHSTREAVNGQIVVARVDGQITVRRLRHYGSEVWLISKNPEFAPICVNLQEQTRLIEGVGVGVIRTHLAPPENTTDNCDLATTGTPSL
jgi:repressor LexA